MTDSKLDLESIRTEIDRLDQSLLQLLEQRGDLAQQVADYKNSQKNPVYYRPEREAQLIQERLAGYQGKLSKTDIEHIFRCIIASCRALQKQQTVAYLGPAGTFSQQAVQQQFGSNQATLPKASIAEVFHAVESQQADFAVVPIENTTTGIINETLDLLLTTSAQTCEEVSVKVRFDLLSQETEIAAIEKLFIHPQAALQCKHWLKQNLSHVKHFSVTSNAEAAKQAANCKKTAALASPQASELYQLKTLATNLQDNQNNLTRFLVLGNINVTPSGQDKTTLLVTAGHQSGSLCQVLEPLAKANISLNLITSRPRHTSPWRYFFYLDIDGHQANEPVKQALAQIQAVAFEIKILGSYPKG